MVPLSHFPSVCLETICKHVPLVELLRSLGLVCTSFHSARHTDLNRRQRVVIRRKGRLLETDYGFVAYRDFLFSPYGSSLIERVHREDGSPWHTDDSLKQYQFDALPLPDAFWTGPLTAPSPLDQLSNITQLVLIVNDYNHSALPQIVRLIGQCTRQLVDLKLKIRYTGAIEAQDERQLISLNQNMTNLFACLDRSPSLRHLRMSLSVDFSVRPRLGFLSRLETFAINLDDFGLHEGRLNWMLTELEAHHQGTGTIELNSWLDVGHLLAQVEPQLAGHFRTLDVSFLHVNFIELGLEAAHEVMVRDLDRLCARFSQLTVLALSFIPMPITVLARYLSRLRQLVKLSISLPEQVGALDQQADQRQPIAQVASVRLLSLTITTHSHHYTEQLHIPAIFPNVQVLCLMHTVRECTVCGIGIDLNALSTTRDPRDVAECKRLARQAFWHCDHLHTIQPEYNSDRLITANELE